MPDASCTGWQHTGVTLHACSQSQLVAGAHLDSCRFPGTISICSSCSSIVITRSLILGRVEGASGADLRSLQLIDTEIDGTGTAADGQSSIGNNNYTLLRANVHGASRGANVGFNDVIQDSWLHDWNPPSGAHVTGIGSNGGAHNQILHSWIVCSILGDPSGFACSSAFSIYGDDAPGSDDWLVQNNRFDSGSSYCMIVAGPPSKPYPYTNVRVLDNTFGDMFTAYWHVPQHNCSQYGPVAGWTTDASKGNLWSGNVDVNGVPE
jgi:hypothetical protein